MEDEIVISGMSGRFADCENVQEFLEKLFAGVSMIHNDEKRLPTEILNIPDIGMLKDITKFDSEFFQVPGVQASIMDPRTRILLEVAYETIIDSGVNPEEFRDTYTGVYVGFAGDSHGDFLSKYQDTEALPYKFQGHITTFMANRVSYVFDLKGPSMTIDTACSSSFIGFHEAFRAIKCGVCDSAIVAGVNLIHNPETSAEFAMANVITRQENSKPFDDDADGYVRSESICAILLQRKSVAKRVYATVLNVGSNCDGYSKEGIIHPSRERQGELLEKVYAEVNVDPSSVEYVEAHATGTAAGDPEEINVFAKFFCKDRDEPLLLGSVKSNMGHAEPASGICSLVKAVLSMENGIIPPNLNYNKPNSHIPALTDGRIKVVVEPTIYRGGYVGVNNFGIGGSNVHALLKCNSKVTGKSISNTCIPKIAMVSGRTEIAVKNYLENLERSGNDDLLGLVHDIHSKNIRGHPYRGYRLLGSNQPSEVMKHEEDTRPVWYIFSGLGCQWHGMGKELLQLEAFRQSIVKCSSVLEPYGINLYHMIKKEKNEIVNKELLLIAVTAIQIAMVDLLNSIGIKPDGVIGHSNGELPAAYCDGALTLEQTMLCVFWKNKALLESDLPPGAMAAIGLTWSEAERRCPGGINLACHNGFDNIVVSGFIDDIKKFVDTLQSENIFARIIPNDYEMAFHSKYMEKCGPQLKSYLEKILPNPKRWSPGWISTSVTEDKWNTELAKTCSAEYFTNNTLSPVYFKESLTFIPNNALVIEISPHFIFQRILQSSLPSSCVIMGLSKRLHPNNLEYFLCAIGKMYNAGLHPKIQSFYPKVEYPVPRGTPMLSSMVEWDHSKTWKTETYIENKYGETTVVYVVNINNEEFKFLKGHVVDGRVVYPAAGYLYLVWTTLSKLTFRRLDDLPVMIQDVRIHRDTIMPEKEKVKFYVSILTKSGEFEIHESNSLVASGKITDVTDPDTKIAKFNKYPEKNGLMLSSSDFYKIQRIYGHEYDGMFKGVHSTNYTGTIGKIQWNGNWICFLDAILQLGTFRFDNRLLVPTGFERVVLNPKLKTLLNEYDTVPVKVNKNMKVIQAGGTEICGIKTKVISKVITHPPPKLEAYTFAPYFNDVINTQLTYEENHEHSLYLSLQIFLENCEMKIINVVEYAGTRLPENLLAIKIRSILKDEPLIYANITEVVTDPTSYSENEALKPVGAKFITTNMVNKLKDENIHILVGCDILEEQGRDAFLSLTGLLGPGAFILLEEKTNSDCSQFLQNWETISIQVVENKKILLLKKTLQQSEHDISIVHYTEKSFNWIKSLQSAFRKSEEDSSKVVIVSQWENTSGIVGMVNCLKEESRGKNLRCFFIQDETGLDFSVNEPFYQEQLKKDLLINIYHNKCWGSLRYMKLRQNLLKDVKDAELDIMEPGNFNSFTWIQSPPIINNSNICYVHYASLNLKDVMLASGRLAMTGEDPLQDLKLGCEFSGVDKNGQRVAGIIKCNGMSTTVITDPSLTIEVPNNWSLEQAASIPVAYCMAYYALVIRGRMKRGQSVLIHSGTGGVGLAAITIALHMGATVYTTVGSQEKRDFLKERFPQLTDKNIASSRDESFKQHILDETNGIGVDLVLNSLVEEKLKASVNCLAKNGTFLEIGKYDMNNDRNLGMSMILRNISFHGIAPDDIMGKKDGDFVQVLELVREGIKSGVVQPLPTTVFSREQASDAFKYLSSRKHIGKVVLKLRNEEKESVSNSNIQAVPRTYFDPEKVYIILGGLGGFGLELANWILSRGAKKIVLVSRRGVQNGYQAFCIRRLQFLGSNVIVSTADCTEESGVITLFKKSKEYGPVGGIFNLAVVLKDALFENLTEEDFITCYKAKASTTIHLDDVSRTMCPKLDYFVTFSSMTCGRGNSGQTNYGLANSVMERICQARKYANLPATTIQWGPIGDVGVVAESMGGNTNEIRGIFQQRITSCLSTLDYLLTLSYPVVSSIVVADKDRAVVSKDLDILEVVAETLGITNLKDMNASTTITQLGADSFMLSAIKQVLERDYFLSFSTQDIRNLSLGKIQELGGKLENKAIHKSDLTNKTFHKSDLENNTLKIMENRSEDWMPVNIPHDVLVRLPSDATNTEHDVNIFIVHPIQGIAAMLKPLASLLPAKVWGSQCTSNAPSKTIPDLATYYLQHIKTIQPSGPYLISGYSYGISVAVEMTLQLEQEGESVILVMLDGSFGMNYTNQKYIPYNIDDTDSNLSINVLALFALHCGYYNTKNIDRWLLPLKTWEDQVSYIAEIISKDLKKPLSQIKESINLYYNRIVGHRSYKPVTNIKADVVLILSSEMKQILSDRVFNIKQYCQREMEIYEFDSTHMEILIREDILQKIKDIFILKINKLS